MDKHAHEQAKRRAAIIAVVILAVVLGAEQVAPLSDVLRSQIGVLTVLLTFGFWHLLGGAFEPR